MAVRAKVDLPVCLSPIISSLCPWATGNKQSITRYPVEILNSRLDRFIISGIFDSRYISFISSEVAVWAGVFLYASEIIVLTEGPICLHGRCIA